MHAVTRDGDRFSASAGCFDNRHQPLSETRAWLAAARDEPGNSVERVGLAELDGWSFTDAGQLAHRSGGFFRIQGTRASGPLGSWEQPLVEQFEVGTLGLLVREFDGLLHVLMQAKMEPGSADLLSLAPTLQATRSNAAQLHRGRAPTLAEWFEGRGRVIAEAVLPELGAHFSHKRNRNVIVEVDESIEVPTTHRWLTVAELGELVRARDLVNMPARSVLTLVPFADEPTAAELERGEHPLGQLRAWLRDHARRPGVELEPRPLLALDGWRLREGELADVDDQLWTITGVRVRASDREVGAWSQPLLHCPREGDAALLVQARAGVVHVLLEARREPGTGVTLGPTICADAGLACAWERRLPALHAWLEHPGTQPLLDVSQSREGGRYWRTRHRYRAVRVPEDADVAITDSHRWFTLAQWRWFLRHTDRVHLDARELYTMLMLGKDPPCAC